MLSRYTVFFVASALPLMLTSFFVKSKAHELDFWLMWTLAMLFVGLPVLFAEFGLSARSSDGVWSGMQKLTREADAKIMWRAFAVLSVIMSILLASSATAYVGMGVVKYLPHIKIEMPSIGISGVLMVVVLILALLKNKLLPVGVLCIVIGSLVSLFDGGSASMISVPSMTNVSLDEWAKAVALALISVGVGTGLYWYAGIAGVSQIASTTTKKSLSGYIMPIWLTQLVFGAFGLLTASAFVTPTSFMISAVGMLLIASFLLSYAIGQLKYRFGLVNGVALGVVLALFLAAIPFVAVTKILVVLSLITVILLAIFAGFVMKISHLRKTFNFANELRYNIWRMLVRIAVPLAVILAVVGWVLEWLK